jgi:hypothetical protein
MSPENKYINKSYGNINESVQLVLDRTEFASHYKGRLNVKAKYFLYSLILSFITSTIYTESVLPSPKIYIQTVFTLWLVLLSFHRFFEHHSEKFGNYAINKNIKLLRKKLNLKKGKEKLPISRKFPLNSCWNFTYKEDV